jgi:hypothetical protein
VYNSALYGMVIYCVGCVIPTPLDRAPAETNFSPVFVTSRVTPAFGPTSVAITGTLNLSLAATDPNRDDVLTVRLFEPLPTGELFYTQQTTTLNLPSPADVDDPNLRLGSATPPICLNAHAGDTFDLYAIVADRDFMGTEARVQAGGLSDSNHWEVTCTSM